MDPAWYLWPVFILLNGSAAGISLVAGVVSALSHAELEDLRRRQATAAVALERCRGDQGNTLAAFEVLSAAFVGMSVAERHRIPVIGTGMIPITPTRAFPSPFLPPGWTPA